MNRALPFAAGWVLAILVSLWAMRGAADTDITLNDQARHALNGVALLDMFREGGVTQPVSWLRDYFGHFPSLSMPYHPPLFPAVEALFYFAFGVSPMSARMAVALFAGGAALLLFFQVRSLERNSYVAAACVLIFFSLPLTQVLSADVMLELPALFWVLASTSFVVPIANEWRRRDALLAALLAGGAVWTKQTVFVGLIPLLLAVNRRFSSLRSPSLLVFGCVFGIFVAGYMLLGRLAGFSGISKSWAAAGVGDRISNGLQYYGGLLYRRFGIVLAGAVIAAVALARLRSGSMLRQTHVFYAAWIASCLIVLLALPAREERYLWFAYPALVVITVTVFHSLLVRYANLPLANVGVTVFAILFCAWNLRTEPLTVNGPAAAAALTGPGGRVLYCGSSNGSFIFAMRTLDEGRTTHVIRADKVVASLRELGLAPFVRKFGIRTVVAEANRTSWPCDDFRVYAARLEARREIIPIRTNVPDLHGHLEIYRLATVPSVEGSLTLPIQSTGQTVHVDF